MNEPGHYRINVRALCEFTAKTGDLDLRFTPSPTAMEGIAGHADVVSRRDDDYQKEIPLSGRYRHLIVSGRADGFDRKRLRLEEIKTYRGDLNLQPDNQRYLHWSQLKIYGYLFCEQFEMEDLTLALIYWDVACRKETVIETTFSRQSLKDFFVEQCTRFIDWAEQELKHRVTRNRFLSELVFPFPAFRPGQRQMAETVYKAACLQSSLMLQAPTGIGKTLGTLFPLLKAMPSQQLDRIFFLTGKSPGRALAINALISLTNHEPHSLRFLELTAREKVCPYPDRACHGESCPLAKGFYDRLPNARRQALQKGRMHLATLQDIARTEQVCPYYLSQELARWSDIVIGDYNYFFDSSALLYGLSRNQQWRTAILVDEAHNLLQRSRSMYSAQLASFDLQALRKTAPAVIKKSLNRLHRAWKTLIENQRAPYQVYPQLPESLLQQMEHTISAIGEYLNDHPDDLTQTLSRFYFDLIHFIKLSESFAEHSLFDIALTRHRNRSHSQLNIRNIIPAAFLQERFAATHTAILFSATLNPPDFYQRLLGLPENTPWIDIESPFHSQQLTVHFCDISTRFADREASQQPIAELIAEQFNRQPGNYLAFFSSFDYLQAIHQTLRTQHPDIPCRQQTRHMSEEERQAFLEDFTEQGTGIAFAVLGGAFGEAIDLPGKRVIGAFIATLGLPQLNPVNEEFKRRMARMFAQGYEYTYLYPGMQKIIQAAGRVIRTSEDRGVIYLIDDRFKQEKIKRLLPTWWPH